MTERAENNSRKFEFEALRHAYYTRRAVTMTRLFVVRTDVPIYLAELTTEFYGRIFFLRPRVRVLEDSSFVLGEEEDRVSALCHSLRNTRRGRGGLSRPIAGSMVRAASSLLLQALQEELIRFRSCHPDSSLRKSTKPAPSAPFPLAVRFSVPIPDAFSHYDVDCIELEVFVDGPAADEDDPSCRSGPSERSSLSVRVSCTPGSSSLPVSLRERIAASLQGLVGDARGDGNAPIGLERLFKHVQSSFGTLISSVPSLLETYLVDDPTTGRSVRRVAILKEDIEVAIDVEAKAKATQSPSSRRASASGTATASDTADRLVAEAALLVKRYGQDRVTCVTTGATYIKAQDKARNRLIVDFLHEHGVGTSLKQLSSASHVLTVTAVPSSPEWMDVVPADVEGAAPIPIRVRVFAGDGYPSRASVLCRVQLVDDDAVVPPEFDRMLVVFEKLLLLRAVGATPGAPGAQTTQTTHTASAALAALMARDVAKYCLNHADQAMREAMEMYEEAMSTARGAQSQSSPASPTTSPKSPSRLNEPSGHMEKYVAHLHNLQMDGIDAMSLNNVSLEVLCAFCHKTHVVTLDSLDARWTSVKTACDTCHGDLAVSIQPRIIHASCNTIGVVATSGCKPLDFLPSCSFEVQCDCTETRLMRKQFHQGRWNEEQCRACHVKNAFIFERCVFQEMRGAASGGGAAGGRSSTRGGKEQGSGRSSVPKQYEVDAPLNAGQPLPQTGTCSHYRHSHRWLRFPCCGRRFPCDLCHEQHTDGHEMKWAKSMVCGFCSLEQRVDSKCAGCGKKLSTSASNPNGRRTCFWEGGDGQRDKKRLSRKDPHKYRNSKGKTVSKKSFAAAKAAGKKK